MQGELFLLSTLKSEKPLMVSTMLIYWIAATTKQRENENKWRKKFDLTRTIFHHIC